MIEAIKCLIFISILSYASYCDVKTREVPNYIHIMIFITAFIGVTKENIPSMIFGLFIIPLPLFISAILKEHSIGGADIKFMAACSLLLGFKKGVLAIIIGLALSIFSTLVFNKIQKKSLQDSFALVPFLAIGSIIAYLSY